MSAALARRLGLAPKPSVWRDDAGDWHTLCDHSPNGIRWLYAGPSWRSALEAAAAHCHDQAARVDRLIAAFR